MTTLYTTVYVQQSFMRTHRELFHLLLLVHVHFGTFSTVACLMNNG